MGRIIFCILLLTLAAEVPATGKKHFLTGHLKVAVNLPSAFIQFYCNGKMLVNGESTCPEYGIMTYAGALGELLRLIEFKRNVTFSIVPTESWGFCYGVNNCTGMIGMVNRREVDFALGMPRYQLNKN